MALVNIEFNPDELVVKKEKFVDNISIYNDLSDDIKNLKYKDIVRKVQDFVYESWDSNELMIDEYEFIKFGYNDPSIKWNDFLNEPVKMIYGVCDNIQQIFEREPLIEAVKNSSKDYIIVVCYIDKEKNGGWRWHKNGKYIGDFEHEYEYLSDETNPDLKGVYMYNIQQVKKIVK